MKRLAILVLVVLILPWQLWGGAHPVAAAPAISISPGSVAPGGTIQVTGAGFAASSSGSSVALCTNLPVTPVCTTIPVSSSGTFTVNVTIPQSIPPGSYQVSVLQVATPAVYASFTVVAPTPAPTPTISVSPSSIVPGNQLTISGANWPASSQVQVCSAVPGYGCQAIATSASGTFQVLTTIPASTPSGGYSVSAQAGTGSPVTTQVTVTANNRISLSPSPVVPGQPETVAGSGFGPGEIISVGFPALFINGGKGDQEVRGTADASGNFAIQLPIPGNEVAGNYIVTARGLSTGRLSTALMNVAAQPSLTASAATAVPGTIIEVSGQRWSSNWPLTVNSRVLLTNGDVQILSVSTQVNSVGAFSVQLRIPTNAAPGPVSFDVKQVQGGQTYTAFVIVNVQPLRPGVQFSSLSVAPGGSTTVYVHGFAPGNAPITLLTQVVVQGSTQPIMLILNPDVQGNASGTLSIPAGALPGKITVSVTQPSSGATVNEQLQIAGTPPPIATATPPQPPPPPPTPAVTATPTSTPTSVPVLRPLKFRHLSLWYPATIVGSFNHIKVRANLNARIGVDATITYPNGTVLHYRGTTNRSGRWARTFPVPADAIRGRLRTALVQVFLVNGATTSLERSLTFRLVPQ